MKLGPARECNLFHLPSIRHAARRIRLLGVSAKLLARRTNEGAEFARFVEKYHSSVETVDLQDTYNKRFYILNELARRWGFFVYNSNLMWLDDDCFWGAWREFKGRPQRADRKYALWSLARHATTLPGDTAECGVLDGASSYLICLAKGDRCTSTHHVFDSFEGLSQPVGEDVPESEYAWRWAQGDLSVDLGEVKNNLSQFRSIRYYAGWIPQRFAEVEDTEFCFVHVDVDLYQPTKDSIEFFYERLVPGGILLCDDYGYHTCPGARKAFDDFVVEHSLAPVVHLPTGQGFVIKAQGNAG